MILRDFVSEKTLVLPGGAQAFMIWIPVQLTFSANQHSCERSPNIKYKTGSFPCLIQTGESSILYLRGALYGMIWLVFLSPRLTSTGTCQKHLGTGWSRRGTGRNRQRIPLSWQQEPAGTGRKHLGTGWNRPGTGRNRHRIPLSWRSGTVGTGRNRPKTHRNRPEPARNRPEPAPNPLVLAAFIVRTRGSIYSTKLKAGSPAPSPSEPPSSTARLEF